MYELNYFFHQWRFDIPIGKPLGWKRQRYLTCWVPHTYACVYKLCLVLFYFVLRVIFAQSVSTSCLFLFFSCLFFPPVLTSNLWWNNPETIFRSHHTKRIHIIHAFQTCDNRLFNLFLRLLSILAIWSLLTLRKQCTLNDVFQKGPRAISETLFVQRFADRVCEFTSSEQICDLSDCPIIHAAKYGYHVSAPFGRYLFWRHFAWFLKQLRVTTGLFTRSEWLNMQITSLFISCEFSRIFPDKLDAWKI